MATLIINKGKSRLDKKIVEKFRNIYDPEIAVNIYDLGLIYSIDIDKDSNVDVTMTLTTPNCPVAETFPIEVETAVREIKGVGDVKIDITFEPPWTQDMMSEEAKLEMGFMLDM